jgi:hypothetical protein
MSIKQEIFDIFKNDFTYHSIKGNYLNFSTLQMRNGEPNTQIDSITKLSALRLKIIEKEVLEIHIDSIVNKVKHIGFGVEMFEKILQFIQSRNIENYIIVISHNVNPFFWRFIYREYGSKFNIRIDENMMRIF